MAKAYMSNCAAGSSQRGLSAVDPAAALRFEEFSMLLGHYRHGFSRFGDAINKLSTDNLDLSNQV
jgi:hypothetical protein